MAAIRGEALQAGQSSLPLPLPPPPGESERGTTRGTRMERSGPGKEEKEERRDVVERRVEGGMEGAAAEGDVNELCSGARSALVVSSANVN